MSISVREILPAIPAPAYYAVTASAAMSGYAIQRTAPVTLVELTGDLTGPGSATLPSAPRNGDEITAVRHGDGLFDWTVGGEILRYRNDAIVFRWNGTAWIVAEKISGQSAAFGGGTTLNETTGTPGPYEFVAGGQFNAGYTDPAHTHLQVSGPIVPLGNPAAALTATMYVALPDPNLGVYGYRIVVEKGDPTTDKSVVVVGFDIPVAAAVTALTGLVTFTGYTPVDASPIIFRRGTPPTGLNLGQVYFIRDSSGATCKLATTVGGTALTFAGSNSVGLFVQKGRKTLSRPDQFQGALIVGTPLKKWQQVEGGQQSMSGVGQDLVRATPESAMRSVLQLGTLATASSVTTANIASEGYTPIAQASGSRAIDLANDKRFIQLTLDLTSTLTLTLPTVGVTNGEWRTFFRLGGGAFNAIITPVGGNQFELRGKREMVTVVWDATAARWEEFYVDRNLALITEPSTSITYSFDVHAGAWVYLTATSNITIAFPNTLPTQSETIFIVVPHTAARTITLTAPGTPPNVASFEGSSIITVPATTTFSFRTKVVQNTLGTAAKVYVLEQSGGAAIPGPPADGSITPAKFAVVVPSTIVADATVDITWHKTVREIAASVSPIVQFPRFDAWAGVTFKIHRPITQPSPVLTPTTTNGTYIGGAQLGHNRIAPGGTARVDYGIAGRAIISGDLTWGGDLTATDIPGMVDLVDLRRGQGLTMNGQSVTTWASVGAGSGIFTNATALDQPILQADGSVFFDIATRSKWLGDAAIQSFAGHTIIIGMAYRMSDSGNGASILNLEGDTGSAVDGQVINPRQTADTSFIVRMIGSGGNASVPIVNVVLNQWTCIAISMDKNTGGNPRLIYMTNSQAPSGEAGLHLSSTQSTPTQVMNWNTTTNQGFYLGRKSQNSPTKLYLCAVRVLTNCDALGVNSLAHRDALIRVLGGLRNELPPGAEG